MVDASSVENGSEFNFKSSGNSECGSGCDTMLSYQDTISLFASVTRTINITITILINGSNGLLLCVKYVCNKYINVFSYDTVTYLNVYMPIQGRETVNTISA